MRTSALPAAGIIVAGSIPIIGVVSAGWSVVALVVLYWLELAISSVETAVKVLFAADENQTDEQVTPTPTASETVRFRPRRANIRPMSSFLGGYGFCWVIYGVFIFLIFVTADPGVIGVMTELWFLLALGMSLLSSGLTLSIDYIGKNAYRTATPDEVTQEAFNELFFFFLGLIFGTSLVMLLGSPLVGLLCLVIGKILYDLSLYGRTQSRQKTPA
ncbi:hypothetical protein C483_04964 [Natrialba hulunbeirensis JCM 10989]|uniref:Uncharacterized protein n=1 Tax=Natrialba hulunbeirensis JCM 10989 TaxID=1227493 RepID=M0A808_9EURY|nr:DUF6498-containing protein [Natrialba hulunbeirensis]ELY94002.1 hypothetical protein C483_04964 [Natrialba hulunbeirensis JCM 10989]